MNNRRLGSLVITSVLYLGRQDMAVRGHENDEGNFVQLLRLCSCDVPTFSQWCEGRHRQYTSWAIQNEIIELSAHHILSLIMLGY